MADPLCTTLYDYANNIDVSRRIMSIRQTWHFELKNFFAKYSPMYYAAAVDHIGDLKTHKPYKNFMEAQADNFTLLGDYNYIQLTFSRSKNLKVSEI